MKENFLSILKQPINSLKEAREARQTEEARQLTQELIDIAFPILSEYGFTYSTRRSDGYGEDETEVIMAGENGPVSFKITETWKVYGLSINRTKFSAGYKNNPLAGTIVAEEMWKEGDATETPLIYIDTLLDRIAVNKRLKLVRQLLSATYDRWATISAFDTKSQEIGGVEILDANRTTVLKWAKEVGSPTRKILL